MNLKKQLMICSAAVALTGVALPAQAAPWTRGFVVGAYEYAFRYGGRPDFTRGAEIEPGVDCPHGSTVHLASPDQTRIAIARQDYITAVQKYNTEIRTIPGRWWRAVFYPDAEPMQNFTVKEGTETVPEVKF